MILVLGASSEAIVVGRRRERGGWSRSWIEDTGEPSRPNVLR